MIRFRTLWRVLPFFLLAAACEKMEIGEPIDCRIGKLYKADNGLSFSIDSLNDSRCPRNALCFWTGDVDLYFNIHFNKVQTDTLISLLRNNPFVVGNFTWKILEVTPYPEAGSMINPEDYRIKMVILQN
jgi:hypothetical protein